MTPLYPPPSILATCLHEPLGSSPRVSSQGVAIGLLGGIVFSYDKARAMAGKRKDA
jgi:hypothetical protein